MFYKRNAKFGQIWLSGVSAVLRASEKLGDYAKFSIRIHTGQNIKLGNGKYSIRDVATKPNSAINVGVAAVSATNLRALTALGASGTTTFLDVASLGAGVMDYPRSVRLAADAGTGDGTFVGAGAMGVTVTGTDFAGNVIKELVPLNGTTAVNTKKMFKTVTRLDPALNFDSGTDQVSLGTGGDLALLKPCQSASDIVEYGVKAAAATAYTVTALPTVDVGEAYVTIGAGGTGDQTVTATATVINLPTGTGTNFPSARAMAEIISPDGETIEEIIITGRSTDALTVVRGANGTTARAWSRGAVIAWRPGMSFTPGSITANDRFSVNYLSGVI